MLYYFFFFFNDTATTEIYTLSLHDALPIRRGAQPAPHGGQPRVPCGGPPPDPPRPLPRLQSGKHRRFLSFICLTLRRHPRIYAFSCRLTSNNPAVPGTLRWQPALSSASFGAIDTLQNGEVPCVPEYRQQRSSRSCSSCSWAFSRAAGGTSRGVANRRTANRAVEIRLEDKAANRAAKPPTRGRRRRR